MRVSRATWSSDDHQLSIAICDTPRALDATVNFLSHVSILTRDADIAIKSCFVVFGVTLRLLVMNISSSVSRDQQSPPLTATSDECHQLATVRRHRVYNIWRRRSQSWQHATKWDTGRKCRFFHTPPEFDAPRGSPPEYCHNAWYGKIEWCGYSGGKNLRVSTEYTNVTDTHVDGRTDTARRHRSRLCIASRGKK